jgi:exodeoxyribonuclease VII large subunit
MRGFQQDSPFTVSTLTSELKTIIESRYSKIYVEAEISGWKVYSSGHAYFTLKDETSQIQAVMFSSSLARCAARQALGNGAKVLVYANATVYPQRGNYQLIVLAAKLVGEGDLMRKYLELKAKLEQEGLFDAVAKKRLPFMPRRIGIVTSPSGAVIHDMCNVISRRFPNVNIRLYPASVQGDGAPLSLITGLEYFEREATRDGGWAADVVIIARGGGSYEDLFCFNDEFLVRKVAGYSLPIISAVGHETDFTLCDFAADVRAGTPSIAAEMVVPVYSELLNKIASCRSSLASSLRGVYWNLAQRIDFTSERISDALKVAVSEREADLRELIAKLNLLSPYSVLERGYSITTNEAGYAIRDASALSSGDKIRTKFAVGEVISVVE